MKAFRFRLEQARRFRDAQLTLQQAKLSQAAAKAAQTQRAIETNRQELLEAAVESRETPTGATLAAYADFTGLTARQLPVLQKQDAEARRNLAAETTRLLEAKRRLQLLEGLRDTERSRWQKEFDRETAAFVDETFLSRLNSPSKLRGKSTGA